MVEWPTSQDMLRLSRAFAFCTVEEFAHAMRAAQPKSEESTSMETVKLEGLVRVTLELETKHVVELMGRGYTLSDIYALTIESIAFDDREIVGAEVIMVGQKPRTATHCVCSHAELVHAGHSVCSFCECREFRPAVEQEQREAAVTDTRAVTNTRANEALVARPMTSAMEEWERDFFRDRERYGVGD